MVAEETLSETPRRACSESHNGDRPHCSGTVYSGVSSIHVIGLTCSRRTCHIHSSRQRAGDQLSGENLLDDMGFLDAGQALFQALERIGEAAIVDAQAV